jgi:cytochrome c oxidase assembly factor 6
MQPKPLGSSAPSKQSRKECWKQRDVYFDCLEQNRLWLDGLQPKTHQEMIQLDPLNPPVIEYKNSSWNQSYLYTCRKFRELYKQACLPSWVSHFETTRVQEKQKQYLLEKLEKDKVNQSKDEFWDRVQAK